MSDSPKMPERGDTVFVPDMDGTWLGGICNGYTEAGEMIVGVIGHLSGANVFFANDYLVDWCYPGDVGLRSVPFKRLEI